MKESTRQKITLAGLLITLSGAILFSTKAIIVKKAFAATGVDAVTLLTLRMLFSLPFYVGAALFVSTRESNVKMTKRQWILTLLIGFTGYYLSSLFDFIGLQYISAGLERLILFFVSHFRGADQPLGISSEDPTQPGPGPSLYLCRDYDGLYR